MVVLAATLQQRLQRLRSWPRVLAAPKEHDQDSPMRHSDCLHATGSRRCVAK